ncbi:acyl carrier protein [Nocardia sp. CA-128927]|uniref:acyl carrier protein n=1 Tax=Nocardia sp. CA-128927 TaxID=3239975 RepID=UPI003D9A09A9
MITGVRLSPTVTFDHGTPAALAAHLQTELMEGISTVAHATATDDHAGSIGSVFTSAISQQKFTEALEFLSAAGRTRTNSAAFRSWRICRAHFVSSGAAMAR